MHMYYTWLSHVLLTVQLLLSLEFQRTTGMCTYIISHITHALIDNTIVATFIRLADIPSDKGYVISTLYSIPTAPSNENEPLNQ